MSVGESEKETARQSRSLSTSQKARIKSEKKSSCIDRGRHGVKNLRTGLRLRGICDIHRERKERNWIEKMAPICQGSLVDFCMIKEVMALRSQGRNIDPLISLLFFKLWPTEHKCITNQFNPVILIQLCSFTWCVADKCQSHSRVSVALSPGQGKSPDLRGMLTWQGHTSHGILTSGSETMEISPTASYRLLNLPLLWYYPYSNEGSFLLFFDLSSLTFCWWTGSVLWVVGHKLTKMSKLVSFGFSNTTQAHHACLLYLLKWGNNETDEWLKSERPKKKCFICFTF